MSLEPIITQFQSRMRTPHDFRGSVKFDLGADGAIFVDTTQKPGIVREGDGQAALILTLSKDLLNGLLSGTKDPNVAYLTGKLKIKGPMGMAMKLNAFL
jgi:putative sterol carrier protein